MFTVSWQTAVTNSFLVRKQSPISMENNWRFHARNARNERRYFMFGSRLFTSLSDEMPFYAVFSICLTFNLIEEVCSSLDFWNFLLLFYRDHCSSSKDCRDARISYESSKGILLFRYFEVRFLSECMPVTLLRKETRQWFTNCLFFPFFKEKELRERIKSDFASLVQELFSNCFSMKNRFEEFRWVKHQRDTEN